MATTLPIIVSADSRNPALNHGGTEMLIRWLIPLCVLVSATTIAFGAPKDDDGGQGSDPAAQDQGSSDLGNDGPTLAPFGNDWLYVAFPGFGTFTLEEVQTKDTDGWRILQGFGGSIEDFQPIPLMTPAPTQESGAIIIFMPTSQSCGGDFNSDGAVDLFDVLMFIAAFETGHPSADLDADGEITFFDLIVFIGRFSSGC